MSFPQEGLYCTRSSCWNLNIPPSFFFLSPSPSPPASVPTSALILSSVCDETVVRMPSPCREEPVYTAPLHMSSAPQSQVLGPRHVTMTGRGHLVRKPTGKTILGLLQGHPVPGVADDGPGPLRLVRHHVGCGQLQHPLHQGLCLPEPPVVK